MSALKSTPSLDPVSINTPPSTTEDTTATDNDDKVDSTDSDDESSSDDGGIKETDGELQKKITKATALKDEGNGHFKEKSYDRAIRSYRRGVTCLKKSKSPTAAPLLLSLHNNMSMVHARQSAWPKSVASAREAVKVDPTNVKALFRLATGLRKQGDLDSAREAIKKATDADPDNKDVKKEVRAGVVQLRRGGA